jgi:hypothetical protein
MNGENYFADNQYYFEKKIENEPQKLKIAKDLYPRMDY